MKEYFKELNKIFSELCSKHKFRDPFFYSLNHHHNLNSNELYKPMAYLRNNYGTNTITNLRLEVDFLEFIKNRV